MCIYRWLENSNWLLQFLLYWKQYSRSEQKGNFKIIPFFNLQQLNWDNYSYRSHNQLRVHFTVRHFTLSDTSDHQLWLWNKCWIKQQQERDVEEREEQEPAQDAAHLQTWSSHTFCEWYKAFQPWQRRAETPGSFHPSPVRWRSTEDSVSFPGDTVFHAESDMTSTPQSSNPIRWRLGMVDS